MIRVLGVKLNTLAIEEDLCAAIPTQWLSAWRKAHPTLVRESARRASLAGLWLLAGSGAEGTLSYTDMGKPMLSTAAISITHTKACVFCAVSDDLAPIGLDAEDLDGRLDADRRAAMAARWFSADEQKLASADAESFYRVWTRKEAVVKMSGVGLCGVREINTEDVDCRFYEFRMESTFVTLASVTEKKTIFCIR